MKTNGKITEMPGQNARTLIHCPVTCNQVAANASKQFPVPGGQAIWYHCPECLGWHVFVGEDKDAFDSRLKRCPIDSIT
jgi:hypothetical protein